MPVELSTYRWSPCRLSLLRPLDRNRATCYLVNNMVNMFPEAAPFDVLGDRTRRRIVVALAEQPRPATELARLFRVTKPAISRHLRLLRAKGVVAEFPIPADGRVRMYRVQPQALDQVRRWTDEVRAFWEHQLHAFADAAREDAARARKLPVRRARHRRRRKRG